MKKYSKQFYKYIKQWESDSVGVQAILFNGELISDDHVKTRLINEYFHSVFCSLPLPSASICEKLPPVEVSIRGIERLLKNTDETKAIGPDEISPRILKRCADEVALCLSEPAL